MKRRARLFDAGRLHYGQLIRMQMDSLANVARRLDPEIWILCELEPVITLGAKANPANVLLPVEELAKRGVTVQQIDRGGDVTYHGPGQLCACPVRRLARPGDMRTLVRGLEDAAISCCAHFGVEAEHRSDHAGVWVGRNQIASLGFSVREMVTQHGMSFNADISLDFQRLINPCGLTEFGVTSLTQEASRRITVDDLKPVLLDRLESALDLQFEDHMAVPASNPEAEERARLAAFDVRPAGSS